MKTINDQIPASGTLPNDYQEVLYWTITGKPMRVIALNIRSAIAKALDVSLDEVVTTGND